ncbi:MAG: 50S ribosomal protein L10 [Acidimicrobiales bacterium]
MARPDKAAAVAELTEGFRSSSAVVLTEYRGLTVAQLKELRRSLGENVTYAVVKNTLTRIAAREASVSGLDDLLAGPSAIAFVSGDPVEAAKGLRDFARANPLLVIKGGVMDGRSLTPDEIRKLADLESREVLLAKLAGAMKASLSGAVSLFAAPLSQTARLIEALRQKAEQDPSVLRGGAGAPVPQPVEEEAPAVQDEAVATEEATAEATEEAQSQESPSEDTPSEDVPAEDVATEEPVSPAGTTEETTEG